MTYAIAFGLVWVYGAGCMLPILYATLTITRPLSPWQRLGVAFAGSLAWPVVVLGWVLSDA